MDIEQVKELVKEIDNSSLMFFDFKTEHGQLTLSKRAEADVATVVSQPAVEVAAPVAATTNDSAAPIAAPEPSTAPSTAAPEGRTVDSPIVGVVYLAPAPDAPQYKHIGDTVAVGDVLCIVEAMKIMNEIKSDVAGTVTEILVGNQQVVEFGQPLFRIK